MLGIACNPESVDDVPDPFSYTTMATGYQFDLPYMVEQWDDTDNHVEELIALTGDYRRLDDGPRRQERNSPASLTPAKTSG